MKKSGYQNAYENDNKFNAVVRRISALPFIKPCDLEEAFSIFTERAESLEDEDLKIFTLGLIDYAQIQWRERFSVQDWNLFDINCLLVPSTNNGNDGANGRFLTDFGVHPPFGSFIIDATTELERAENDIPSILYSSLLPKTVLPIMVRIGRTWSEFGLFVVNWSEKGLNWSPKVRSGG